MLGEKESEIWSSGYYTISYGGIDVIHIVLVFGAVGWLETQQPYYSLFFFKNVYYITGFGEVTYKTN